MDDSDTPVSHSRSEDGPVEGGGGAGDDGPNSPADRAGESSMDAVIDLDLDSPFESQDDSPFDSQDETRDEDSSPGVSPRVPANFNDEQTLQRAQSISAGHAGGAGTGVTAGGGSSPDVPGYRMISQLGKGNMGTVWRAVQLSTDREVALKTMWAGRMTERAKARFRREVKLAARLDHPNIATIFDSGLNDERYFYAMKLIDGEPLEQHVRSNRLGPRDILKLMVTVCEAMHHAHENGVIHRDLKPDNIIVNRAGDPVIVDFGLAKTLEDDEEEHTLTQSGDIAGTPAYMAPEQADGRQIDIDARTDVYGLGAILFRLLVGDYPTEMTGSRFQVLFRIVKGEIRFPTELSGNVDVSLEKLLLRALERLPADRFQTSMEFAQAIKAYANRLPDSASPPKKQPAEGGTAASNRPPPLPPVREPSTDYETFVEVMHEDGGTWSVPIRSDKAIIGRAAQAHILCEAQDVSRQHAELFRDAGGTWYVRDLKSLNGIQLNGENVKESDLIDGDIIQIGDTFKLVFHTVE